MNSTRGEEASISYLEDARVWLLATGDYSYAFSIDTDGYHLKHLYWGAPISEQDARSLADETRDWWLNTPDTRVMRQPGALWRGFESAPRAFMEEIVAQGGFRFDEPTAKVETADSAGLLLRFVDHTIEDSADEIRLTVSLIDTAAGIRVELHYAVLRSSSALARWITIHNDGDHDAEVLRLASGSWALPPNRALSVRKLFGHVQGEFQLEDSPLTRGRHSIGSRTGTSGHHGTPWIALHDDAREDSGEAWSVALGYSGSWEITTQMSDDGGVHVVAGVSDEEVRTKLAPGTSMRTPRALGVYSSDGFTKLSHEWHDYARSLAPRPVDPLPVMYNSWFASQFEVDAVSLLEQARIASRLGVELFVIDDGWFDGRNDDFHGLGRWTADREAFPLGMSAFNDSLRELGLNLGLWVEPEMCTPDSQVFAEHPEWIHGSPGRFSQTHRNQYVLDFGNPAVRNWVIEHISQVVQDSGCAYVVWDMNRPIPLGHKIVASSASDRHADGITVVLSALRERHPDVIWQACSGGGGRADLGILESMSLTWPSDNTDAHDRATMISAASQVLPPSTLVHWVTDLPTRNERSDRLQQTESLATRFHTGMNGLLGISADLQTWSDEELTEATRLVEQYKGLRGLISGGLVYRLNVPDGSLGFSYVSRDQATAAVIVVASRFSFGESVIRLRIRGLDRESDYSVDGGAPRSGRLLMQEGIVLDGTHTTSWALSARRLP